MRQYAELQICHTALHGITINVYTRLCGADLQGQWHSSGWGIACDYVILCENQPPYAITDKHDKEHLYSILLQKAKTWNDVLLHFITYAYLSISKD